MSAIQNMKIELPMGQWQVVIQLLLAAPYLRSKDILEAIQGQARKQDEASAQARVDASLRVDKMAQELAKTRSDANNAEYRVARLQSENADLERKNALLTKRLQEISPRKPRKARKPRNGAAQEEATP
jgi:septal ring factor EnvC (AmiA/AmiB activator)